MRSQISSHIKVPRVFTERTRRGDRLNSRQNPSPPLMKSGDFCCKIVRDYQRLTINSIPSPMKLQRTTVILVLLALGLAGFVYYFEFRRPARQEVVEEKERQLFSFEENQVQSVTVKIEDSRLAFERQAETDSSKWLMTQPESAPASDASLAFLLSKLVNATSDRVLTVEPEQLQDYGLDEPRAIVEITLDNRETHQLRLGNKDFTNSSLYALIDSENAIASLTVETVEPEEQTDDVEGTVDLENASVDKVEAEEQTDENEVNVELEDDSTDEREENDNTAEVDSTREEVDSSSDSQVEGEVNAEGDRLVETERMTVDPGEESSESQREVETKELKVVLVPADFEYAVDRPLSEWKKAEEETSDATADEASDEEEDSEERSPEETDDADE